MQRASGATPLLLLLVPDRTFVKFTFFKLDPAWRRRSAEERARDKAEFQAACDDFAEDRSLRAYSTVGTRGDTDLLILSQSPVLEDLHTFHVVLGQSGLARWSTIPYSYLAMTKPSPYSEESVRPEIAVSERKYLFVYPFDKKREWYALPMEERQRIMASHIEVGRRYPEISINTDLLLRPRRPGVRRLLRGRRPRRVPRPRPGAPHHRVERLHPARHPDLHLRRDVAAARARRARRRRRHLGHSRLTPRPTNQRRER